MTVRRKNGCGGKHHLKERGGGALGRKKRGNLLNCLREGMKILENCCFQKLPTISLEQQCNVRAFCTIIFVGAEVKISLPFCCCCCSGSPMQSRDRSSSSSNLCCPTPNMSLCNVQYILLSSPLSFDRYSEGPQKRTRERVKKIEEFLILYLY